MEQTVRTGQLNNLLREDFWRTGLCDSFPFALRVIDRNYVIVAINTPFISVLSDLTGKYFSKKDIIGSRCYELMGKAQPCQGCLLPENFSNNKSGIRKETFSLLQGRTFEIHTQPIAQSNGKVFGIFQLLVEVTAQHSFEELVNLISDAVYIVDVESRKILAVNQAACAVLGYSMQELLNLQLEDIDPNYSDIAFTQFINGRLSGEKKNLLIETINKYKSIRN